MISPKLLLLVPVWVMMRPFIIIVVVIVVVVVVVVIGSDDVFGVCDVVVVRG